MQALAVASGARHYHLLLTPSGNPLAEIEELLRSKRVDGFVFSTLGPHDQRIELVADLGVPFACFGRTEPHLPQTWIDIDNAPGLAAITRLLITKGHKNIVYLGFEGPYMTGERTIAARIVDRLLREIDGGPTGDSGELVHLELKSGDSA